MKYGLKHTEVQKLGSLLLLAIYLLVGLGSPMHTLMLHHEDEVECVEEDDACHLLLVHNDIENGCDHETHLISGDLTCDLCALRTPSSPYFLAQDAGNVDFVQVGKILIKNSIVLEEQKITGRLSRGPPSV